MTPLGKTRGKQTPLDPIELIEEIERHDSVAWVKKFIPIYLFHFIFLKLA